MKRRLVLFSVLQFQKKMYQRLVMIVQTFIHCHCLSFLCHSWGLGFFQCLIFIVIYLTHSDFPQHGIIEVEERNCRVTQFMEKPQPQDTTSSLQCPCVYLMASESLHHLQVRKHKNSHYSWIRYSWIFLWMWCLLTFVIAHISSVDTPCVKRVLNERMLHKEECLYMNEDWLWI